MKLTFQLFTGDLTPESLADADSVLAKLEAANKAGKLAGVFCGWSTDSAFYQQLSEKLHSWGVPFYLKMAVFSELKGWQSFDPMIDFSGNQMEPYVLNPQESFEFRCPASKHNQEAVVALYDQYFSHIPFDGIFLDRIRYSSFLSGMAGIGGCFCPDCQKRYAQAGIAVNELRQRLQDLQRGASHLNLKAYEKGCWQMEDPVLDAFFRVKSQILEEALQNLTAAFHARNLQVGFDLFAPSLGYFCGQNVQRLRQIADFVKPMMYRYTLAPAGIPFEKERFVRAAGEEAGKRFEKLAGSCRKDALELMQRELTWLSEEPGCPVWPGIEANYIEPIAKIKPQQIRENLQLLQTLGYEQIVVSWNLAKIPQENMEALLAD